MGDDLFTSPYQREEEQNLSAEIRAALAAIRRVFNQPAAPVRWNDDYIAVPLTVSVELPSRGTVGNIDIRPQEDIFLVVHRRYYPDLAPKVRSNRKDFPKGKLPHINPTGKGTPADFCLHRGSLDAWFAEHTIVDLVNRARGWLRDAARNRLIPEGDVFERTMVGNTQRTLIYEPQVYFSEIKQGRENDGGAAGWRFVAYDLLDDEKQAELGETGYSVAHAAMVSGAEALEVHLKYARVVNLLLKEYPQFGTEFQKRLFGLLLWTEDSKINSDYFGELPETLDEFIRWSESLGIPAAAALNEYLAQDLQLLAGVPVTIGVRRPAKVIGTESEIELINFVVSAGGDHWPREGQWDVAARVRVADHRTPLTPRFARKISALDENVEIERTLVLGTGALGSKIAMHLGRSGQVNLTLVNSASLSPHNLVRHALMGEKVGTSKAESVRDTIQRLYPAVKDLPITFHNDYAFSFTSGDRKAELEAHRFLLDATASQIVFNSMVSADLPAELRVCRVEIADEGRIGLLSLEGGDRNPRLDDLQMVLFDAAIEEKRLSNWLTRVQGRGDEELGSGLEEIQVGLSCSSATMRLADEVVSLHAAADTRRLRPILSGRAEREGMLALTFFADDGSVRSETRRVKPFVQVRARNDESWQLHIAAGVADTMREALRRASPKETGGLLVGQINFKRKVVYVTRLVLPKDSRGSAYAFYRGIQDLPETIREVERRTGGLLGYVGEWHTHPMGGPELSDTDIQAVENIREMLDPVSLPTLVTIVTPDGIHPHLFEAGSPRFELPHYRWTGRGFFRGILFSIRREDR